MSGISKRQVSCLCEEINDKVKVSLNRPIEVEWPYVWVDATHLKVRRGGRMVSVAIIIAVGARTWVWKLVRRKVMSGSTSSSASSMIVASFGIFGLI